MAASTLLTDARESVWDAILNWAELDGVFQRTYRHDESPSGDEKPVVNPRLDELPAIEIVWDDSPVSAVLTNTVEIEFGVKIWVYTANWYYPTPEGYLMEISKCLSQESTGSPATDYVKAATNYHPIPKATFYPPKFLTRENGKMTKSGYKTNLRIRFNPFQP